MGFSLFNLDFFVLFDLQKEFRVMDKDRIHN